MHVEGDASGAHFLRAQHIQCRWRKLLRAAQACRQRKVFSRLHRGVSPCATCLKPSVVRLRKAVSQHLGLTHLSYQPPYTVAAMARQTAFGPDDSHVHYDTQTPTQGLLLPHLCSQVVIPFVTTLAGVPFGWFRMMLGVCCFCRTMDCAFRV